jgi:hypothetical protein
VGHDIRGEKFTCLSVVPIAIDQQIDVRVFSLYARRKNLRLDDLSIYEFMNSTSKGIADCYSFSGDGVVIPSPIGQ